MKYVSAEALRDALEARLSESARQGQSITRLRKQVAFERLLCRLQQVAPEASDAFLGPLRGCRGVRS